MTSDASPQFISLKESAALFGRYRFVDLALFELLGKKTTSCEHAGTVVFLADASQSHARRASLFEQLLPVSVGLAHARALTVSPSRAVEDVLSAFGDFVTDADIVSALVSVIYPASERALSEHLQAIENGLDHAAVLTLRRALFDVGLVFDNARNCAEKVGPGKKDHLVTLQSMIDVAGGLYGEHASDAR